MYKDIEDTSHNEDGGDFSSVDIESNNSESCTKFRTKIPTLGGVARMVAREEGKTLDEKQYIMYEVLACTFLLDLINKQDVDGRPALARKMSGVLGSERSHDMDRLTEMLRARGGRKQLIIFVTGLPGAGKSTGINVAQRFCYEFCKAASVMWRDNTFLFTAYTGSAAAAFGGLTTSSATFLGKRNLSDDDRQTFEGVRILVIDEVSFLKDPELDKLMKNLQKLGDPHLPFGGYKVVLLGGGTSSN